jgi:hypothetical protein
MKWFLYRYLFLQDRLLAFLRAQVRAVNVMDDVPIPLPVSRMDCERKLGDLLQRGNGRQYWIRTSDLYDVNVAL